MSSNPWASLKMYAIELYSLLNALLRELDTSAGTMSDDDLQKLRHLFPDNLLLAALDLVDRERVIHLRTSWGRSFYEVHGSTSTYTVQLDLPPHLPIYCSCPSFAFSVLMSEDHILCKHVLAVQLAIRLEKCVQRDATEEYFPSSHLVQCSS